VISVLLTQERLTSLHELALTYHHKANSQTVEYLVSRGFTRELCQKHLLGTVPADCDPAHAQFIGWLSIPYRVVHGVTGFKFRRIDGELGPKYMAPLHQPARLFNAIDLHTATDSVAICEGELDTIIASQLLPSVGVPGAKAWRPHFSRLFSGYRNVYILADNDDKGSADAANPGMELAQKILAEVEQAQLVTLPAGSDVNSIAMAEGIDGLRKRIGIDHE
jgi:DNA primase